MLRLTATWADAWNTAWFGGADERVRARLEELDEACDIVGRDRATLRRTVGIRLADPADGTADATTLSTDDDGLASTFDDLAALGLDDTIVWSLSKSVAELDRIAEARRRHLGERMSLPLRYDAPVKLQEADAKSLLVAQGLPVPAWAVAHTADEARSAAQRFLDAGPVGGKVVIKAQVLVGGRGKAGGVKLASSPDEAAQVARTILGMDIKGMTVRKVLVGPAADIVKEFYLAAVLDRAERGILLMGSAEGGVEIEHVAATNPDAIVRRHADPSLGVLDFQARELAFAMGLRGHLKAAVAITKGLVRTMTAYDADLVEINPLAVDPRGRPGRNTGRAPGLPRREDHAR